MNLVTMHHGPQVDGSTKAGSLEILTAAESSRHDLQTLLAPTRSLDALDADQVNESAEIRFPLQALDVVIMNPPFTANENRSKKYGEAGRMAMQRHELSIQEHVERIDNAAEGVITVNSISTFFTPLADMLLNGTKGSLAKVMPTTACIGPSGIAERRFLAQHFHIETVVTSHDPRRPNFSENTAIHESLLIGRRRSLGNDSPDIPTRFIALRAMPTTTEEAIEIVDAIQADKPGDWFTTYSQPEVLVRKGDWRPCQFLDPVLVCAAMELEQHEHLVALGDRYLLGPSGRRIRDAFLPVHDNGDGNYRVFWSRSKDLHTTMEASPEQSVTEKKPALAMRYRKQAGHVLLSAKFDTLSGKLVAIFSEHLALGSMWVPVQTVNMSIEDAKALCAWHNSTIGILGFLMRRSTKLTNPSFSQAELATLRIPDFRVVNTTNLVDAYEEMKNTPVAAWKHAAEDNMRDRLDQAVGDTLQIEINRIRDLRKRISLEPTVSKLTWK